MGLEIGNTASTETVENNQYVMPGSRFVSWGDTQAGKRLQFMRCFPLSILFPPYGFSAYF
ncbi:hypothetical protein EBAPG3_14845 [Nitrosospira lacus]|nr:hypothetical protein EBAPG3_14845 [Nitrosospira lacus]